MFIWRFAHNSLPVRRKVARRGVQTDTRCPMCLRLDEDCGHLFFKCSKVKLCWRILEMEDVRSELEKCHWGIETIRNIWELEMAKQMKTVVFLWRWWSARNKVNNGGRMQSVAELQNSISYFLIEFEKLKNIEKEHLSAVNQSWASPPVEYYKINTDGAFDLESKSGGWGFVVRNNKGEVLLAGAGNIAHVASAVQAEAIAVLKAIQQTASLGMQRIIVEMDASLLASAISSVGVDRSPISSLVNQIREFLRLEFSSFIVSVCKRV